MTKNSPYFFQSPYLSWFKNKIPAFDSLEVASEQPLALIYLFLEAILFPTPTGRQGPRPILQQGKEDPPLTALLGLLCPSPFLSDCHVSPHRK